MDNKDHNKYYIGDPIGERITGTMPNKSKLTEKEKEILALIQKDVERHIESYMTNAFVTNRPKKEAETAIKSTLDSIILNLKLEGVELDKETATFTTRTKAVFIEKDKEGYSGNSIQIMPGIHVSKPLSETDIQSIKKALGEPVSVTPMPNYKNNIPISVEYNTKYIEADNDVFISRQPQDGVYSDMLINNPEPVFNDPGKALGAFEIISMLKTVEANVFILNIPPGLHDSTRAHIEEKLNHIWEIYDIRTPVLMLPDYARLVGCKNFSFHEALELLKAGFKVQRSKWGSGYLYMPNGIIYHSNDHKEWKPTQKHVLATNWQLF